MPGMPEDNYTQRLQEYLQKALREGKVNSDWAEPDTAYEQTLIDFVEGILSQESEFWQSFAPFHAKVADYGILNSLTQVILKFTCPGIADVYQGTELWDLSLVDPDNRRPVDYTLRASLLEELIADEADGGPLPLQHYWEERYAGKIKLALIQRLLSLRDERNELFDTEYYIKLDVKGKHAKHVFAFARRDHKKWMITAVPLHLALLVGEEGFEFTEIDWEDTAIILPEELTGKWENLLNGASGVIEGDSLELNQIFEDFPLGLVFLEERESPRSAGILLHLTSLPSGAGIGDMGLMSMFFISYLESAKQQYWQLLPLNPISADQGYSPYSSVSAMAGNVLLIAGDLLMFDGLLEYHDYEKSCLADKGKVDFAKVEIAKAKMLAVAYENFTDGAFPEQEANFNAFKEREQDWLDAFALFMVFKNEHNGLPWFQWDPQYRDWDTAQSLKLKPEQEEKLEFIKWQQYVFFEQYARLKKSANRSGIKLYGDLPFYVGHDSADVWSNRHLFSVDAEGKLIGVAGVPPDYFNAEGQLWGMPVYQWDNMKADGYSWWIKRIAKNMEMYNLLRLDHFRAFADYWEVPAGDTSAVNGVWKKGPGADFFAVLQKEFPTMPFVAEDLGEINQAVFALRDEFNLPGMKVLQFAFGEQVGQSDYIPHNYASENFVSYTGTHDNNTTLGWFKTEATKAEKQSLEKYAGRKVSSKNVVFVLTRMAYASVAKIVILPMQDVLELDSKARINTPGVGTGNWAWQLKQLPGPDTADMLRELVELFGRK
jgi:4-alpha-glucanotransferase